MWRMSVYETAVRPLLFRLDAERAHNLSLRASELGGRSSLVAPRRRPRLHVPRPAAGDVARRDPAGEPARAGRGLRQERARRSRCSARSGFGHLEIGSVSAHASDGNPKPRLFRIPQDRGIVVAYGVPNDGAEVVRERLAGGPRRVPVGVNLVKTNDPGPARPTGPEVYEDYAASFGALQDRADYVALNMSCPNSAADRDFFDELTRIDALLERLAGCDPRVPAVPQAQADARRRRAARDRRDRRPPPVRLRLRDQPAVGQAGRPQPDLAARRRWSGCRARSAARPSRTSSTRSSARCGRSSATAAATR